MNCLLRDFVQSGEVEIRTGPFGTQLKASEYVEQGTPVLNVKNLGYSTVVKSKLDRVGPSTIERLSMHILHRGDIVFGRKGAVDRHAYISSDEDGWMQGSDCIRVRVKIETINPRFLSYYFLTPEHRAFMISMCSHGTTMASLNQKILEMIEVPLPDRSVQDGIVSLLGILDNKIELNQKINENLQQQLLAIYDEMVATCEIRKSVELKTLCAFQEGYVNPPQTHPEYFNGSVKWLRAVDINESFIIETSRTLTTDGFESAKKSALLFQPNTVAISKSGTIGRIGIVADFMCGNRAVINIRPLNPTQLPLIYVFLKSKQREFPDLAVGSVQKNLYVSLLEPLLVDLPETEMLDQFCDIGNSLLERMQTNCKENLVLANLRNALLPKLMSSEIDVSDIQI